MNAEEAARAHADAVAYLPAGFMLDGATYKRGGELGFDGVDFYTAGRGGALGDVDGPVVAAAFVFFNPVIGGRGVGAHPAVDGADARRPRDFAAVPATPGRRAICPTRSTTCRLAELLRRVNDGASPSGAPLFAAWKAVPEPARSQGPGPATAERPAGAARGACTAPRCWPRASSPSRPCSSRPRSWRRSSDGPSPSPRSESRHEEWERAEAATNRVMARAYAVLDDARAWPSSSTCDHGAQGRRA